MAGRQTCGLYRLELFPSPHPPGRVWRLWRGEVQVAAGRVPLQSRACAACWRLSRRPRRIARATYAWSLHSTDATVAGSRRRLIAPVACRIVPTSRLSGPTGTCRPWSGGSGCASTARSSTWCVWTRRWRCPAKVRLHVRGNPLQEPQSQQYSTLPASRPDSVSLKAPNPRTVRPASSQSRIPYPRTFRGRPRRRGPLAQ